MKKTEEESTLHSSYNKSRDNVTLTAFPWVCTQLTRSVPKACFYGLRAKHIQSHRVNPSCIGISCYQFVIQTR